MKDTVISALRLEREKNEELFLETEKNAAKHFFAKALGASVPRYR